MARLCIQKFKCCNSILDKRNISFSTLYLLFEAYDSQELAHIKQQVCVAKGGGTRRPNGSRPPHLNFEFA